jgi:hypothetical protein
MRARWSRSRVGEHRDSIPKGAGRGSSPCWTHTAVRLRPRRPTSAVMAVIMAGKRIPAVPPSLPPSLSQIPGISNEELLCRQLEPMMRELLSQPVCLLGENQRREAERHIPNLAREMCEVVLIARGAEVERSKAGKASLAGVSGQLRYIARGADTLLNRMKKADRNVFDAWADAGNAANDIPYHESIRRWLNLRWLLEEARERAVQAAQSVEAAMKQSRASMPENRGRPAEIVASAVAAEAAVVYERLTGRRAVRSVNRDTRDPEGPFLDFLESVFKIFHIDSSPDYANAKLQADLRFLRTSGPGD